jgi:hypothetical protein
VTDEPVLWEGASVEEAGSLPPHLDDLIAQYAVARAAFEMQRDKLVPLRRRLDETEAALFDALEDQNLTGVRNDQGYFRRDVTVDAALEDPVAFAVWAKATMPELLLPNYMRLSKLVRDALAAGAKRRQPEDAFGLGVGVLPPGVDFRPRRGIAWTRGGAATSAPKETT